MAIEELLRVSPLFKPPSNVYAINNTTKLNINLKQNGLRMPHSGIHAILDQASEGNSPDKKRQPDS